MHRISIIIPSLRSAGNPLSISRVIRTRNFTTETKEKHVLVPIANGSEEIEAVSIIDVLRRAGAKVTVASVEKEKLVTASRKTLLQADVLLSECKDQNFDGIFLPGGMPGAERLRDNDQLISLLKQQASSGRWYGAICASPAVALLPHGLLKDKKNVTCHPGFYPQLVKEIPEAKKDARVCVDGNCITSQGPGTSLEFSLEIVRRLLGQETAVKVATPMCLNF